MVLVTQGYGYGYESSVPTTDGIIPCGGGERAGGSGDKSCPNFNYELYVDGEEFEDFQALAVNHVLSALSAFTIDLGNPDGKNMGRFLINSIIEFKASWGNRQPQTIIKGLVKQRNFKSGKYRGISLSGIDFGDYMVRAKPWDVDYKPLTFNNEKISTILDRLVALTPGVHLQITKLANEPKLDWETDPTSNSVLDEFKAIAEYGGYEWFIRGDILFVRPPKELIAGQATYDLVFGDPSNYSGILPDLPAVMLVDSSVDEDATDIKNNYKVVGKEDSIYAIEDDQVSIQKYRGKFDGFYEDSRLTSAQSCSIVAKKMAEINGYPKVSTEVSYTGNNNINVGDVVGVGDVYRGFEAAQSSYLRVVSINHGFGMRWDTAAQLGSMVKTLNDILG